MADEQSFVIIGGGQAGGKAAETLRAEGFSGSVTLLGAEPQVPYKRPPLSKGYLQGSESRESTWLHDAAWYADNSIDLRMATRAVQIDRSGKAVVTDSGARIGFDRLLLTTGASPRRLDVPGADLPGVHVLRTLADSDALRAGLAAASRVAIVGGGWIGLEVAWGAREAGCEVTVVEQAELPLLPVLGPQIAQVFADLHVENGVELITGAAVSSIRDRQGRVDAVVLADGRVVPADLVVVGIGATPNVELAQQAGLAVDNGVVVDEGLRTSDPAILAAGDIANAYHPLLGRRVRVEHWDNALGQGEAAARSMLGQAVSYARLPFFYTDQFDLGMEYVGHVPAGAADQVVTRGDVAGRHFLAFWLGGGRVLAAMHVNVWDSMDGLRALIGRQVDPARLADEGVDLGAV